MITVYFKPNWKAWKLLNNTGEEIGKRIGYEDLRDAIEDGVREAAERDTGIYLPPDVCNQATRLSFVPPLG